jgi:uncharacterized protein (DUF433 family)
MKKLERIMVNPAVMGGKPCIKGTRITVGTIVDMIAYGYSFERILEAYPLLKREDLEEALRYAAYRVHEQDIPLQVA